VWSDKFVSSAGVATHFNYYDLLPYGSNVNQTIASIKNGGFRFVRDGLTVGVDPNANDQYFGVMKTLNQQGIKLVLVTQPGYLGNNRWVTAPYTNQSNLDTAVNRLGTSGILAWEGPNEVDINSGNWGGSAWATNARTYQAAMYAHAKQIAPTVPVMDLTVVTDWGAAAIGDLSPYMNCANMHPYPGGSTPDAWVNQIKGYMAPTNAAQKPWCVTETGYYTAPNATVNAFQPGVSETAQGKYAARLYLDYFNAGIQYTALYELIDEHVDGTNAENNFGILHNDGSPKPAYTAIKNLLGLLADPGPAYTPTTLSYTLSGATSTIRQALFQKRDGRFYLVLWNNVSVYDITAKRDISNASVNVVVTLPRAPQSITRYQPYVSASGTPVTSSTSIAVSVPDHPVILEITP
jgi:hypothetical protein